MEREEFIDYARKSSAVKELTEKLQAAGKSMGTKPKVSLDKAELAFKVRETRRNIYPGFSSAGHRQGQLGLHSPERA